MSAINRILTAGILGMTTIAMLMPVAQAQGTITPIYVASANLEAIVQRHLFNCYGVPVTTAKFPQTKTCANLATVDPSVQFLNASVATSGVQGAWLSDDPTKIGTPSASVPSTSSQFPAYPYPAFDFGDTIAPLSAAQLANYASSAQAKFGPALQFPVMETSVAIIFNGHLPGGAHLNIRNPVEPGGSSGLHLSRVNYCGIFTGKITDWGDTRLAGDNGGVSLARIGTPITVVYRYETVSTTFVLSNHLNTVCAGTPYPWTGGVGQTVTWPRTGNFIPASASGTIGELDTVGDGSPSFPGHDGSIGYVGPDNALPISASNTTVAHAPTANLQNPNAGATKFYAPNQFNALTALSQTNPPSGSAVNNPASWGVLVPNPLSGYPISAFVFIEAYVCYRPASFRVMSNYFEWLTNEGRPVAQSVEAGDGFAPLPHNWDVAVRGLLFRNAPTVLRAGPVSGVCSSGAGV